ncbi:MAG: LemA family protein [Planctomycetota bacterium]|jgi:LemA protein
MELKAFLKILVVLLVLGLTGFLFYEHGYNKAIQLDEDVKTEWENVDAELRQILKLVPSLIKLIHSYERGGLDVYIKILLSKESYLKSDTKVQKIKAENDLTLYLSELIETSMDNPELQENEEFCDLIDKFKIEERQIDAAKVRYNDAVRALNTYTKQFLGKFFCERAGVVAADYFEATEEAKTTVPEVKFE